ncbi:hypothetical protein Syun_019317 [Stephania yunnanensis]|uniref:Uncharacterized protein n=1 Tax=Stephania yunnanensis TaxID=152371 RepID=A0AAP0IUM0_9MAGN
MSFIAFVINISSKVLNGTIKTGLLFGHLGSTSLQFHTSISVSSMLIDYSCMNLFYLVVTTRDSGSTLKAPTMEAWLASACKDTCFGELKLQIWEKNMMVVRERDLGCRVYKLRSM